MSQKHEKLDVLQQPFLLYSNLWIHCSCSLQYLEGFSFSSFWVAFCFSNCLMASLLLDLNTLDCMIFPSFPLFPVCCFNLVPQSNIIFASWSLDKVSIICFSLIGIWHHQNFPVSSKTCLPHCRVPRSFSFCIFFYMLLSSLFVLTLSLPTRQCCHYGVPLS